MSPQRTKIDWAFEMEELLRTQYADAEKAILICDNWNTHTRGALNELSSMIRQCLKDRRLGGTETLRKQIEAWAIKTNTKQKGGVSGNLLCGRHGINSIQFIQKLHCDRALAPLVEVV